MFDEDGLAEGRAELANVRFWPIADIPSCTAHVRFRGRFWG
jgi:hypothetical protein